jgi:hypothetical protein
VYQKFCAVNHRKNNREAGKESREIAERVWISKRKTSGPDSPFTYNMTLVVQDGYRDLG